MYKWHIHVRSINLFNVSTCTQIWMEDIQSISKKKSFLLDISVQSETKNCINACLLPEYREHNNQKTLVKLWLTMLQTQSIKKCHYYTCFGNTINIQLFRYFRYRPCNLLERKVKRKHFNTGMLDIHMVKLHAI